MAPQDEMSLFNGSPSPPQLNFHETASMGTTKLDDRGSTSSNDLDEPLRKRDRAKSFARKAKEKAKELYNPDDKQAPDAVAASRQDAVDKMSSDPAFNPSLILNQSPPKPGKSERRTFKSELKSAANTIAHPRQAIQDKATGSAAARISRAQRPFLSAEQDKDLLAAHDELDMMVSSRSSTQARTPAESGAETSGDEDAARQKVEKLEEQRSSLHVAWTLGKQVDRVKTVQSKVPKPLSRNDFVEKTPSGEPGRFQWERWLGYQALYHTRGFTARYIDDFEEPPFDIQDLSRIVERLVLVGAPWQAWLVSIRQVYVWEDPRRTGKWFALFCFLWYTNHIMGFLFAFIIYTVIRNKYHPSSIDSVRHSMKRGVDRETHAQAWGELVERHGRKDWIEPLLNDLGPYIQLQLGDLTDILEVLTNFYRWKAPWKTAETLFFFGCCLLITLLTDMAFCVKIIWFVAGGWFFLCFPIASRFPKYRYLMDPAKWILWDIPTDAEWSIEYLQRKVSEQQEQIDRKQHANQTIAFADESSNSDYETPMSSPQQDVSTAKDALHNREIFRFRAFQGNSRGHLLVGSNGIRFKSRARHWSMPYSQLIEMCKVEPDFRIKTFTVGIASSGLRLIAGDGQEARIDETVTVPEDTRNEIFNVILGWSGLKWRAVCMERYKPRTASGRKKHS
jgi:hypothetical protein